PIGGQRAVAGIDRGGGVVAADQAAAVGEPLAREQAAGAADRAVVEVDADHVIGAAGQLGDDAADAAAELDGERDPMGGAGGDPLDQRRGRVAAAGAAGRRGGAIAPVGVEVDREV